MWYFENTCFLIRSSSRHPEKSWPRKRTELKFKSSVMANVTVLESEEEDEKVDEKLDKLKTEVTMIESESAAFEIPEYRK